MKRLLLPIMFVLLFYVPSRSQRLEYFERLPSSTGVMIEAVSFPSLLNQQIHQLKVVSDSDEDLPFENDSLGGVIMNWIAMLLLWFIYAMLAMLIIGVTFYVVVENNIWCWVLCFFAAFFYAMIVGRYWGYGACLTVLVILFYGIKVFLITPMGKKMMGEYPITKMKGRLKK